MFYMQYTLRKKEYQAIHSTEYYASDITAAELFIAPEIFSTCFWKAAMLPSFHRFVLL